MLREAPHVHLVDEGAGERPPQRPIAPVVGRGRGDHALHRRGAVVAGAARGAAVAARRGHRQSVCGSRAILCGSNLRPRSSANGPCAGRRRPGRAADRDQHVPVVIGPVRLRVEPTTREAPAPPRRRRAARAVALFEKTLKLTPSAVTVAPSGRWFQADACRVFIQRLGHRLRLDVPDVAAARESSDRTRSGRRAQLRIDIRVQFS